MILPLPSGRITAPFLQPRPLDGPKTHIHGAIDVAPQFPRQYAVAPVSGTAQFFQFLRPNTETRFPASDKPGIMSHPYHNYFYDLYGGLIAIREKGSSRLHILTHFWANDFWTRKAPDYIESRAPGRFPCVALMGDPFGVLEGERLAPVGNAGYSTGAHIHWEIHPTSDIITPYEQRLDPEQLLKEFVNGKS